MEVQKPLCPLCRQADQVKTLQAAYESGVQRFAPPPMPVKQVSMIKYIGASVVVITICSFFVIVLLGTNLPDTVRYIQAGITIAAIVAVLVIAWIAFQRVVQGDAESQQLFPAWDQAMENWSRLRYCTRDNIVFDPQQNKAISDEALVTLLAVEAKHAEADQTTVGIAQSASR